MVMTLALMSLWDREDTPSLPPPGCWGTRFSHSLLFLSTTQGEVWVSVLPASAFNPFTAPPWILFSVFRRILFNKHERWNEGEGYNLSLQILFQPSLSHSITFEPECKETDTHFSFSSVFLLPELENVSEWIGWGKVLMATRKWLELLKTHFNSSFCHLTFEDIPLSFVVPRMNQIPASS